MSDRTLSRTALDWAIECADLDSSDTSRVVREDYTTYGNVAALGLVVKNEAELSRIVIHLVRYFYDNDNQDAVDDLNDMFGNASSDSMGQGMVMIFPGYTLVDG